MRYLNEQFSDEEFARLKRGKGDRSWRQALLDELAEPVEVDDGRA